jgi:hypothetical protein
MAEAIRFCVAMPAVPRTAAAHRALPPGGWAIGNLAATTASWRPALADGSGAEALNREISLQPSYVPDLPPCRRVVTASTAPSSHRACGFFTR